MGAATAAPNLKKPPKTLFAGNKPKRLLPTNVVACQRDYLCDIFKLLGCKQRRDEQSRSVGAEATNLDVIVQRVEPVFDEDGRHDRAMHDLFDRLGLGFCQIRTRALVTELLDADSAT